MKREITQTLGLAVGLWMALLAPCAHASYPIAGVEGTASATPGGGAEPRQLALVLARETALERLLNGIVTVSDRQRFKGVIDGLRPRLLQQADKGTIRGERVQGDQVIIHADFTFSPELSALLNAAGVPHATTPYPPVLIVEGARDANGNWHRVDIAKARFAQTVQRVAQERGLTARLPQGDIDDMVNLPWEQVREGIPAMQQWATGRYGSQRVWAVWAESGPPALGGLPMRQRYADGQLLESKPGGGATLLQGSAQGGEGDDTPLLLARQLVGKAVDGWILAHAATPTRPTAPMGAATPVAPAPAAMTPVAPAPAVMTPVPPAPVAATPAPVAATPAPLAPVAAPTAPPVLTGVGPGTIVLTVEFGGNLATLARFQQALQNAPHVAGLRTVRQESRSVRLEFSFQGDGAALSQALTQLGGSVEQRGGQLVARLP